MLILSMYMELKSPKVKPVIKDKQIIFKDDVMARGFKYYVVNNFNTAIHLIEEFVSYADKVAELCEKNEIKFIP